MQAGWQAGWQVASTSIIELGKYDILVSSVFMPSVASISIQTGMLYAIITSSMAIKYVFGCLLA